MIRKCFVAMPFDGSCDLSYNEGIVPVCKDLEMTCIRIDDDRLVSNIMSAVVKEIYDADIVIADITGSNPNVFYELGISHTLPYPNKTIMIAKQGTKFPFDIYHHKIILYNNYDLGQFKKKLKETIYELLKGNEHLTNPVQEHIGYYNGLVLTQEEAVEQHKIELKKAIDISKYTLVFLGTTLFSILNQSPINKLKKKIIEPDFSEISFVVRNPLTKNVSRTITKDILRFLNDNKVDDLLKLNNNTQKVFIYICDDFVRYSASYIDHLTENGIIRITHSIYGSLMEDSPSYALNRKKNLNLYKNLINSWNDLKERKGTKKISNIFELEEYRKKVRNSLGS